MYSIAMKLWSILSYESAKIEYEKQLDRELAILDDEISKEDPEQSNEKEIQNNEPTKKQDCFRKTGVITSVRDSHGVIDKIYMFNIAVNSTSEELKVGFNVEYLGYKNPDNNSIKIVKIDRILNDYWDDNPSEQHINNELSELKDEVPEYFNTHQRSVLGLIKSKNENLITIDTDYDELVADLDLISLEFVPQIGDRVYLNCKVQTDTAFIDSTGEILEVLSIHPARSKTLKAFITYADECWGVVGEDCYFLNETLPIGYKANEGDRISADVIECDRDKFIWRCIKIVPLEKSTNLSPKPKPKNNSDLFLNKNGIIVTDDIKFSLNGLYERKQYEIIVTNDGDQPQKILKSVFLGKKSQSQLRLLEPKMNYTFFINPKESRSFRLQARAQVYGLSTEIFVINFPGFRIGRKILIEVGTNNDDDNSNNTGRVNKYFRNNGLQSLEVWTKKYNLINGNGGTKKSRFIVNRIGSYEVSDKLKRIVLMAKDKFTLRNELEEMYPCLKESLSPHNYVYKFQNLLHLEEIEYFQSMRKYDRQRAHFTRENEFLALEIENLAEKRPSLVIGDSIRISNPWSADDTKQQYEGVINKVLYNRILLKFNSSFHTKYNGEDYKIEFYYSRSGFRKQHYAIKTGFNHIGKDILFPTKIRIHENVQLNASLDDNYNLIIEDSSKEVKWYNSNLNSIQKIAIKNVLRGEARPMPYIIFGPPGTGKTLTLVETILQLFTLLPNCRLLVATPSNSSADLIATRLIDCEALQPGDFVRLVSHNLVEKELIPDHLKPYCATIDIAADGTSPNTMITTDSGLRLKCQIKHLGNHRITIGTCITLGTLLQLGFPPGHFTHLLIDEAGQCTEPESMICISQIDKTSGQIILTGDPLQLGPIILDRYAAEAGLETSLLVRLLSHVPYAKDKERFIKNGGYDQRLVTKLIYNYRSIPSILKIFNHLFYDSELEAKVNECDSKEIQLLKSLNDILPKSETRSLNHGVFFVGIRGENRQDSDSPSWYNAAEAKSVFLFLLKLYKKQISSKNIGIITPYQKQVRTIRNTLIEAELILPKIGSVEEFQGQERDIILISTVRSSKLLVQVDLRHTLGFVKSFKRMNVAISRPRSLLVIFGNPHLLSLDSNWGKLIKYCVDNDAYIGCDLPSALM